MQLLCAVEQGHPTPISAQKHAQAPRPAQEMVDFPRLGGERSRDVVCGAALGLLSRRMCTCQKWSPRAEGRGRNKERKSFASSLHGAASSEAE